MKGFRCVRDADPSGTQQHTSNHRNSGRRTLVHGNCGVCTGACATDGEDCQLTSRMLRMRSQRQTILPQSPQQARPCRQALTRPGCPRPKSAYTFGTRKTRESGVVGAPDLSTGASTSLPPLTDWEIPARKGRRKRVRSLLTEQACRNPFSFKFVWTLLRLFFWSERFRRFNCAFVL